MNKISRFNSDRNRQYVWNEYINAKIQNDENFENGDLRATEHYIYPNQKEDAKNIVDIFYNNKQIVAVSIIKRTKVGMDGLMIELAKNFCTHEDDEFMIHRDQIYIITGMSNLDWEKELKNKIPKCFQDSVYHHGKIHNLKHNNISNAVLIIDEIDSGSKVNQKLDSILQLINLKDYEYIKKNKIKIIMVSATMNRELKELYGWGDSLHRVYKMTIPENYISHLDFINKSIIKEFFKIDDFKSAERWIKEDIIQNYANDYRVHIIRTDEKNKNYIENACDKYNISFFNHTSDDRIEYQQMVHIFNNLKCHTVIAIKNFYRRANLIPNQWKLKIGATHERHVETTDMNVQVQGLPGRMTGYWKKHIENGHKTGPYRTSIDKIKEYEEFQQNPIKFIQQYKYNTTFCYAKEHIHGLLPNQIRENMDERNEIPSIYFRIYNIESEFKKLCQEMNIKTKMHKTKDGWFETSFKDNSRIHTLEEILQDYKRIKHLGDTKHRRCFPCYINKADKSSFVFLFIIRDENEYSRFINDLDKKYIHLDSEQISKIYNNKNLIDLIIKLQTKFNNSMCDHIKTAYSSQEKLQSPDVSNDIALGATNDNSTFKHSCIKKNVTNSEIITDYMRTLLKKYCYKSYVFKSDGEIEKICNVLYQMKEYKNNAKYIEFDNNLLWKCIADDIKIITAHNYSHYFLFCKDIRDTYIIDKFNNKDWKFVDSF